MTFNIHTDGGARGNPGPAATGIIIEKSPDYYHEFGVYIGNTTNNIAEYSAVLQAMEHLESLGFSERGPLQFYLDSELVVKQLTGQYKIKNSGLAAIASLIQQKVHNWNHKVSFQHIPRNQNSKADGIVNQVLDNQILAR